MPRPRPLFLHRQITRHGKPVWYVRPLKGGPRTRIKAVYDTPEFWAAYDAVVRGENPTSTLKLNDGPVNSLAWLIARYREVDAWKSLSLATRRQRENIFKHVLKSAGRSPYKTINRAAIVAGRDRRSGTPAQARHFIEAMRGLCKWAVEAQLMPSDPTDGVKNPKGKKTGGFPIWTDEEVERYESHWPLGTKERVWLNVLLYTGLRRGDAVTLGKQHVRNGVATLRTEKSQGDITVTLPILPVLAATLKAGPIGKLAFICGDKGKPLTKESFGNLFRKAVRAAGIEGKSAHGLRKVGATRAAENGATVAELEAIFGWRGGRMASLYTEAANRARLSRQAMGKLAVNESGSYGPSPNEKVRAATRKRK
jgi:integrase